MIKTLSRITGMLALALLAAQAGRAQEPVLANIPFAFTVGDMTLPAGEYRVEKVRDSAPALLIQRTDGGASIIVITYAVEANAPQAQTKLTFRCYAKQCFLSQVWTAGNARGRELPNSRKEKEQGLLAHNETPEQVTIVARLIPSRP
ncbi:MAG TPA: hypothetical protein VF749_15085 [Candidatus Acidoferrum sp.]